MQLVVLNVLRGPYRNGSFGQELVEALLEIRSSCDVDHVLVQRHLDGIARDLKISRDDYTDQEIFDKVLALKCFVGTSTVVVMRRFFSFVFGLKVALREWTARILVGRWITPRVHEIVAASGDAAAGVDEEQEAADDDAAAEAVADDYKGNYGDKAVAKQKLKDQRGMAGNELELSTKILEDEEIRVISVAMVQLAWPFITEYLNGVESHSQGQLQTAYWAAWRAGGGWQETLRDVSMTLLDWEMLADCGFEVAVPGTVPCEVVSNCSFEARLLDRAGMMLNLAIELMQQRAWTQVSYSLCLPHLWSMTLAADADMCESGMLQAEQTWRSCMLALFMSKQPGKLGHDLREILVDVHFVRNRTVLELGGRCDNIGWDWHDAEFREAVWSLNGTILNTKTVNEDPFGYIRDMGRASKNSKLNLHVCYRALSLMPQLVHGRTEDQMIGELGHYSSPKGHAFGHYTMDAAAFHAKRVATIRDMKGAIYSSNCRQLPKDLDLDPLHAPNPAKAAKPFKPGGPLADMREAAAVALLRLDFNNRFSNVGQAWCGCMMGKGLIFRNTSGEHYMSLGFHKWAWLGWKATRIEVNGVACFTIANATGEVEHLVNLHWGELSEWRGIPVAILSPKTLPPDVGVGWIEDGKEENVLRFAVQNAVLLQLPVLRKLKDCLGLDVVKLDGDAGLTQAAFAWALVRRLFPYENEHRQRELVAGIITERKKKASGNVELLKASLKAADSIGDHGEAKQIFKDLQHDVDTQYDHRDGKANAHNEREVPTQKVGAGKGKRQYTTPKELMVLLPGGGEIDGVSLNIEIGTSQFHGRYRGALGGETSSRKWGGKLSVKRPADACSLVVAWLWSQHGLKGHAIDDIPTESTIQQCATRCVDRTPFFLNVTIRPSGRNAVGMRWTVRTFGD